jgi:hypothetical protein
MTALALDLIAKRAREQYEEAETQCLYERRCEWWRRFGYITA